MRPVRERPPAPGSRLIGPLIAAALLAVAPPARAQAGDPPPAAFELSSYGARALAAHRLTLEIRRGEPEIDRAALTYPAGFVVLGFAVTPGTPVGSLAFDVTGDGTPDRVTPLVALGGDRAYADTIRNGRFDAGLEPELRVASQTFDLRLPFGGDLDPATEVSGLDARIGLTLSAGVVRNPALGGAYELIAQIAGPVAREVALSIAIDGPRLTPFRSLVIDTLDADLQKPRRVSAAIGGRFALAKHSDGVQLASEDVTVALGPFTQTVPGRVFTRTADGYRFKGRAPGITSLTLRLDGRFQLQVEDLHFDLAQWQRLTHPVLALRLGNDLGETPLATGKKKP